MIRDLDEAARSVVQRNLHGKERTYGKKEKNLSKKRKRDSLKNEG